MREAIIIDGIDLIWREKERCYVAVLGPDYVVHVRQVGRKWFAKKAMAREDIADGLSINECIRKAAMHYGKLVEERRRRIKFI